MSNEQVTENNEIQSEQEINFLDNISEDLRSDPSLKDFKDINGLAKSYINAQKMIGNSVRIPSEDASPEARQDFLDKVKNIDGVIVKPTSEEGKQDFYNKLGRPESKDAYNLQDLINDEIKAVVPNVSSELERFQEEAFQLGLTNEQAQALISNRMMEAKTRLESQELETKASVDKLNQMWGQDYDNRLNAAKQMAKVYSDKYPTEMDALINSPAGNNPAFLNMLVELGSRFKEEGHIGMQKSTFGMTPDGARDKIKEKRSDRGFMDAYTDDTHPGHKKAVAELQKLYQISNQ